MMRCYTLLLFIFLTSCKKYHIEVEGPKMRVMRLDRERETNRSSGDYSYSNDDCSLVLSCSPPKKKKFNIIKESCSFT